MIWACHTPDPSWHAVREVVEGGSVVTFCNGRWPTTDPDYSIDTDPPADERCPACVANVGANA